MPTRSSQLRLPNRVLDVLPAAVARNLLDSMELCHLRYGKVVHDADAPLVHVYFPIDCVLSLLTVTTKGRSAEVSVVGNEGMVGIELFMGAESSPLRAEVLGAGRAWRLDRAAALRAFTRHADFMQEVLRYALALMAQVGQAGACARHHSLEQRLCRWLLQALDRHTSQDLNVTHELIARMLGVRREGVTEAARKLQVMGLIDCGRSHIHVLDRAGLEGLACECYRVVKTETERVLATRGRAHSAATPLRPWPP